MSKVYVVAAKRSPFGKFLGSLSGFKPVELGTIVTKAVIKESGIDPKNIDETIMGLVLSAGQKPNIARQISVYSGIPVTTPAYTINMLCGSGMKAINEGYKSIKIGDAHIIVAGGVECMSDSALIMPSAIKKGIKMGGFKVEDHFLYDGLVDAFSGLHMGVTAENIAKKYNITREEQDELALHAHNNAERAIAEGLMKEEIVDIEIKSRKGTVIFSEDEHYRKGMTIDSLTKLRPAFAKENGTVTAGNASGINDGASVVILASQEAVDKYNLKPLAEVIATGQGGVEPDIMGMGPVPATENALSKTDLKLSDIEYGECNEAFAAQALGVYKEFEKRTGLKKEWFLEHFNRNGSAISLGHPVAATGPRLAMHVINEMKRRDLTYGLATMCIGGGMGVAIILKNIK